MNHFGGEGYGQVCRSVTYVCYFGVSVESVDYMVMVETGHQEHISTTVIHHHKCGIGDGQCGLVVTLDVRLPICI